MKAIVINKKHWIIKTFLIIGLVLISVFSFAQTDPTDSIPGDPGGITVYTVQNMSFGAFSNGSSGGTVIVSTNGTRSLTGDIVLLNLGTTYFQSVFDIDAPVGSIVSLLNGRRELLYCYLHCLISAMLTARPALPFLSNII